MKKIFVLFLGLVTTLCASAQVTLEGDGLYLIPDKDNYKGYHKPEQTSFYLEYGETYYFQVDSDYYVTVTGVETPDLKIAQVGNSVYLFYDWDGLLKKYNMNQTSEFLLPGCNSFKMASGIYSVEPLDPESVGDAGDLNFGYMGSIEDFCGYYNDISVQIRYTTKKRVQKSSTTYSSGPWVFTARSRTYYETVTNHEYYMPSAKLAKVLGYDENCYAFYIDHSWSSDDQMSVYIGNTAYKVDWASATNGWVNYGSSMGSYSTSPVPTHSGNVIIVIYDSSTLKYHMTTISYNGSIGDYITLVPPISAPKASSDQTYSISGIPGAQEGLLIKDGKKMYIK